MVMPISNATASGARASGNLKQGKIAVSLHAALQSTEQCQRRENSPIGSDSLSSEEGGHDQPRREFQPYHRQSVPKLEKLQTTNGSKDSAVTTLMFRNIPNKYTQNTLLCEIDEFGFANTYNFFYLPMDVHNKSNVGYAFINFETPNHAEQFRAAFSEHRFQRFNSRKIGGVCTAHVQGLEENIRHFENRAVTQAKDDQYRPVVLKAQQRIEFEDAVAEVKASGLLGASPSSVDGIAVARQGLEAAIRDLLASSTTSSPSKPSMPLQTSGAAFESAFRTDGGYSFPAPPGEPAYIPAPTGANKSIFSRDSSSDGPMFGAILRAHLHSPEEPLWCAAA